MKQARGIIGHGIGGFGHNLIYVLFIGFLLSYYTEVVGFTMDEAALLIFAVSFIDAINDPIIGLLADKLYRKTGKMKSWLYIASPIASILLVACFSVPRLEGNARYIYCAASAFLFNIAFTAVDVSFWTLPTVMTDDTKSRNKIYAAVAIMLSVANGIGYVLVPMLTNISEKRKMYFIVALGIATVGLVCHYVCAAMSKETIRQDERSIIPKNTAKGLNKDIPLIYLMVVTFFSSVSLQLRMYLSTYYSMYILGDIIYSGYMSVAMVLGQIIGPIVAIRLYNLLGAKISMLVTFGIGATTSMILQFAGYGSSILIIVIEAIRILVCGIAFSLPIFLFADIIHNNAAKGNPRREAFTMAGRSCAIKLSVVFSFATSCFVLQLINYVPNAAQADTVLNSLHKLTALYPGLLYGLSFLIMLVYPLGKKEYQEIEGRLKNDKMLGL